MNTINFEEEEKLEVKEKGKTVLVITVTRDNTTKLTKDQLLDKAMLSGKYFHQYFKDRMIGPIDHFNFAMVDPGLTWDQISKEFDGKSSNMIFIRYEHSMNGMPKFNEALKIKAMTHFTPNQPVHCFYCNFDILNDDTVRPNYIQTLADSSQIGEDKSPTQIPTRVKTPK